ncbi:type I-C CRISPR-associated protein Cas5c [Acuticoccus mangrovi]|uniref:pre-crRNA processing endonuclease n=1 Tax=Acuticoccus mangrovi TaxID=2796142 RepID=A0A934ITK0_9HYPH|nr:type I-C CRISPR-associated protein Cas5c [Acuticoccus mangrovi]MBJ3777937.1 type I-C CRISPR-associated protein Cas5 [Acuticoccus mangrovi]
MTYGIHLHVSGPFACFTRPEMKVERVSYDVMTPSAARGILEAVHWKPAIRWVIDSIHVLKPIRFQSIRRNEVGAKASYAAAKSAMRRGDVNGLALRIDENRQQRASTVLVDVAYVIEAHFEMTAKAGPDDNPAKHFDMFNRRAARGQAFVQPVLGTREFDARFTLVPQGTPTPVPEETEGLGFDAPRDLGFMLWDVDHDTPGKPSMFFRATLTNGVLMVPQPGSPEILK